MARDALDLLMDLTDENNWMPYLLIDENKPIGIFAYQKAEDEDAAIKEILLVSFERNNITVVRDSLNIMDDLQKEFDIIEWSVDNNNSIKKAYDKLINKWDGTVTQGKYKTFYLIEK